MRIFVIEGVTFELCHKHSIELAEFVLSMNKAKADIETFRGMSPYTNKNHNAFYNDLYKVLSDNLDKASYEKGYEPFYNECYHDYIVLNAIEDEKYREYAEADFLEFASHKNEPNFDWEFYSDWHKDLYGFRPRH